MKVCDEQIARFTLTMSQDRLDRPHGDRIIDALLDARCVASELLKVPA